MVVLTLWGPEQMETEMLKTLDTVNAAGKFAIGNDLVYIPAFQNSFNDLFKKKVYTEREIAYCELFDNAILRYASTWAAKEAVYKAIKQLDNPAIGWKNIEILREKIAGRPQAVLTGRKTDHQISLTISHEGDYVWAIAFIDTALTLP